MAGERRRRRLRRTGRATGEPAATASSPADAGATAAEPEPDARPTEPHRPSPADLADLPGPFALTQGVADTDEIDPQQEHRLDDTLTERGLRGLVGSGSSQVAVAAAMRARDASRPSEQDEEDARANLTIVRRGWVPREELPRPGARR